MVSKPIARTTAALLLACVVACGAGQQTPAASSQPTRPNAAVVSDFCGADAEARIRAAHPELPVCGNRSYVYLEARVGRHALLALAHEADPCCTDVGGPGMGLGAHIYVDGQAWPAGDPIALTSPPANAKQASVLLHAELMRLQVVRPIAEASAVRATWPAAAAALKRHSLGLQPTANGWRLGAAGVRTETERGIHCRSLAVWEAELDGVRVQATRVALYSEGNVHGEPCQGDPLPR